MRKNEATLKASDDEAEVVDLRHDNDSAFRKANRFSLNQGSPMPLWLKARARAIGFRHNDLVRSHWNKVWRSMVED